MEKGQWVAEEDYEVTDHMPKVKVRNTNYQGEWTTYEEIIWSSHTSRLILFTVKPAFVAMLTQ